MASEFREAVFLSFSFMLCAYLDYQTKSLGNDSNENDDRGVYWSDPARQLDQSNGLDLVSFTRNPDAVVIALCLIAPKVIDLLLTNSPAFMPWSVMLFYRIKKAVFCQSNIY